MKYAGRALGADTELSLEREGIRLGSRFLDFAGGRPIVAHNAPGAASIPPLLPPAEPRLPIPYPLLPPDSIEHFCFSTP